jgi:hypothetical protein
MSGESISSLYWCVVVLGLLPGSVYVEDWHVLGHL